MNAWFRYFTDTPLLYSQICYTLNMNLKNIEFIPMIWQGPLSQLLVIFGLLFAAWISKIISFRIITSMIGKIVKKTSTKWDDQIFDEKTLVKVSNTIPIIVIYLGLPLLSTTLESITRPLSLVLLIVIITQTLNHIISGFKNLIHQSLTSQYKLAVDSSVQVIRLVLYFSAFILALSVLLNKNPMVFISGLVAITAALMFVFKDPILGFVASIQLSSNDFLRPGDWIEMPDHGIDGTVLSVTLNNVKVQNWDKTIVVAPTYSLIAGSFKNWRGMSDAKGRRIKRNLIIDINSVCVCAEDRVQILEKSDILGPIIQKKRREIAAHNDSKDLSCPLNGRRLSNLGLFRLYCEAYILQHPDLHDQHFTAMVRQLSPTPDGLPLQIYVFSKNTNWVNYEHIQADIFEHFISIIPEFGLRLYQSPNGKDIQSILSKDNESKT